jgi:hypothetical protein
MLMLVFIVYRPRKTKQSHTTSSAPNASRCAACPSLVPSFSRYVRTSSPSRRFVESQVYQAGWRVRCGVGGMM